MIVDGDLSDANEAMRRAMASMRPSMIVDGDLSDAQLESADLHIARVKARVGDGGHDVPEGAIRQRYDGSREHLVSLIPFLAELRVIDNSENGDPQRGLLPKPKMLLHMRHGRIESRCDPASTPDWVKPVLAAALALSRS